MFNVSLVRLYEQRESVKLMPGRAIFRERAIQHHLHRHEKHVLPGFVSPPVFLFLWIIIGLSAVLLSLAWNTRIPVYISGTGMIVQRGQYPIALLLIPSEQLHSIHRGQPVQLHVGSSDQLANYSITSVAPVLLSPDEIRRQYHLDGTLALLVTQPAVVVEVKLDSALFTSQYLGSVVKAEVQIGSQKVLSVLPLVGPMMGE
jgi:hypothetical protein